MAFTNFDTKEIHCKVIYFGPRGAGKTANLCSLFRQTSADLRSGLLELEEEGGSTQYFDFLPISLGHVNAFHLKLHLFTMPVNSLYDSVPTVFLKGVDGFVFVADSRIEAMIDNVDSLAAARRLLTEAGYNMADMPRVIQYNKRDLKELMPLEILRQELNPNQFADQDAVAIQSVGTMETLQAMTKQILKKISP